MTRYTRAKGSKACNNRKEEEATPWHVMRQQLFNQSVDNHVKENSNISNNLKNVHSNNYVGKKEVWSDFVGELKRKSNDGTLVRKYKDKKNDYDFERKLHLKNKKKTNLKQISLNATRSEIKHNNIELGKEPVNFKNKGGEIIVQNILNEDSKTHDYEKVNIVKETKRSTKKQKMLEKTCGNPSDNNCDKQSYNNNNCHSIIQSQTSRSVQQKVFTLEKSLHSKNHLKNQQSPTSNYDNSKKKVNPNQKWNNESCTIIANGREIKVVRFEGFWIKKHDALELKKLRKGLRLKNIPKNEIKSLMKLERRKAEKSLAREKNNVCFQCRKFGHNFSDCPDIKDTQLSKSGMCFKCGSMEHSFFKCKVLQNQDFRFAVCFVCQDQGHIARQCPLNSQGQYPKGGSCHLCGEVTHLRKDCPKAISEKTRKSCNVEQMKIDLLEDLSEVTSQSKTADISKTKVVKF